VFSFAPSLTLGGFSPALPALSTASNGTIAVCFAPEEDRAALTVRAIDNPESKILVGALGLTTRSATR
jgi:hypothetical protein